jgi:hypothetical protein
VQAIRVDVSYARLGTFYIKDSIINLLDISGCQIKRLVMEESKIGIIDASNSDITTFIRRMSEFANPPDYSGSRVHKEVEK